MTDDGSSVQIPRGAVAAETMISISPVGDPAAPTSSTVVGPAYLFEPEGAMFTMPVRISLAVVPSMLPAGKTITDVQMYTAPKGSTAYTALPTTVVDATHVSATTNHFSVFVPAVASVASTCKATCTNGDGQCTCTATCDAQTYTMSCYNLEGCVCNGRGVSVQARCNDIETLNRAWTASGTMGCGFPGSVQLAD